MSGESTSIRTRESLLASRFRCRNLKAPDCRLRCRSGAAQFGQSELRDLTEGGVSQSAPFVFSDSDIFQEKGNSSTLYLPWPSLTNQ